MKRFSFSRRVNPDSRPTVSRRSALSLRYLCATLMLLFGIGQVWATEEVVYTLTPSIGSNNAYASNCDITIDDIKWNVTGNASVAPWRIGGKNISGVDRALFSKNVISNNVSKIEIVHGAASSITVNSMTVIVSQSSDFSNPVSTLTPTFAANTTVTVERPEGKDWSDCYYKIVYNVSVSGNTNRFIAFTSATFYAEESTGGDVIVKTLKSIEVSGMTTTYDQNDVFSFDGTCTATYSVTKNDESQADESKTVTPTSVSTPDMTTAGEKVITVSFTDGDVSKETSYNITVAAAEGDKLTRAATGVESGATNYSGWTEVAGASGAVYAGNSAGSNDAIQLRSTNNSGIVSTTSGGLIKKVKVVWQAATADARVLNVYGSNNAYESAADLYDSNKQGTLLGTFTKSDGNGTLDFSADENRYEYIGVRSNSNAMYLTSVTFVWEPGKELSSIAVKTNPTKTSYNINDEFAAAGLVITATYDDTSTEDIAYTGNEGKFSFTGFNSASATAAQTITVTYGGQTATFNVEILDITLQSVTVSGTPTTTSYTAGNTFDPEGLTVTGHYSDNSDVDITTGITWSYPDNDAELSFEQTSIRVVATVDEIASAPYTVSGLTVAAAPLVANWVASGQGYSTTEATDMTEETIAFGPSDNFSLVFDKGTNTNTPKYYNTGTAVRAYGGNTFTLSSTNYNFKQIVITFGQSDGSNAITTDVETYNAGTWTGKSKRVVFTIGGTTGNRRISAINITYEEGLPSVATPTFSVAAGTYFETQNVAITTETADATIYYTTDGSTPTTESNVYSEPVAVSTGMTIKAIAVKDGMDNSAVASATYAMGPIFASLEDLVAADLTSNTMVKVTFSDVAIKTIDGDKKYVTFNIQKEEKDIEIYFAGVPVNWVTGGTLSGTITAPWVRYTSSNTLVCWELKPATGWAWDNLTYTSPITKTIDHVTVSGTATKTEYVDGEVFDPAGLVVTLYYTDETNEVVTEGIVWAPSAPLTQGETSVNVTATVENTTSVAYPVEVTVSEIPTKTIAEFIAAGGGRCYLVGVVSNLANENKNCTLTDNSGSILLYKIYNNSSETDYVTLNVEVGDRIKVIASEYQLYNTKDEVVGPEFVEELAPEVVAVTGVTVAPTTATVKVGKTVALTATVSPALATNTNVSWESDDTDVATVEDGVVTGVADGTAHITVTTEDGLYTATTTITVEAAASYTSGEWMLVTDVAQLILEDKIIIASTAYQKAMNTQNSNNRAQADVTITGDILTYESAPVIFTLKEGNAEGQFAFYDEDAIGYLYAASSSKNYLRTQEEVNDNSSWTITISAGVTSVVATASTNRNVMQYNSSDNIFSCYALASQQPVALYKYYSTPLPRYTITFTANGGTGDAPVVADQLGGAKFNLPANTFTYDGHQFTGWNDGTNTYAAGANYTVNGNVTFTAQWVEASAHDVTYNVNGSTDAAPVQAAKYEGDQFAVADAVTKDGYTFKGWLYNNKLYKAGATFTMPAEDVTFTAQWQKENIEKYNLITDASQLVDGMKVVIAQKVSVDAESCKAMGSQNTNNRAAVDATLSGNVLTLNDDISKFTLVRNEDGMFSFRTSEGKYLYAASSSNNYLREQEELDANGKWKISFYGREAIITAQGTNKRNQIRLNTSGTPFSCYGTGEQASVCLYGQLIAITDNSAFTTEEHNLSDLGYVDGEPIVVNEGQEMTIDVNTNAPSLTVEVGAKVTVTTTVTYETYIFKASQCGKKSNQTANPVNITADNIYFDLQLEETAVSEGWYSFTVPFPVSATNGIYNAKNGQMLVNGKDYRVMTYDSQKRANGEYGWVSANGNLVPGQLYMITLGDTEYTDIRFRKLDGASHNTADTWSVTRATGSGNEENDYGWNGIGNGTSVYRSVSGISATKYSHYDHAQNKFFASDIASMNFVMGSAFFIKAAAAATLTWSATVFSGTDNYYAPAREGQATEEFLVRLGKDTESYTDQLYVSASENASDSYEEGHDLVKFGSMGASKTADMSVLGYGKQLCDAEFPLVNGSAEFPLVINNPEAGTYNIYIARAPKDANLYLTYEGQVVWNLSQGAYEMDLTTGETNGYGLKIVTRHDAPTAVDEINAGGEGAEKAVIDGNLYILRQGKVFDATGKQVK